MNDFEIAGLEAALAGFDKFAERFDAGARKTVAASLLHIQNGAKQRSRVDTGRMRAAWQIRIDADGMGGEVYNDVDYVWYHELGTRFISPQPMAQPALDEEYPNFLTALGDLFK